MKNLTTEEKKKILRERARAIACESEKKDADEACLEIIAFSLADEIYAIETAYIQNVCPLSEFTPLPGLPPFIPGIINVHGRVFSIVDIKKLFDLPEEGLTKLNRVVIIKNEWPDSSKVKVMEFGIMADTIIGRRTVPLKDIAPSLPTLTGIREEYLRGITKDHIVILDAHKLLTDKKMIIHEEV